MKIFQPKSPIRKLETALSDARAQRGKLAARLAAAEQEAEARRNEAVRAAISDDHTETDRLEDLKRRAEDRATTLTEALKQLDIGITKTESDLAAAIDMEQRSETSERLNKTAAEFDSALPAILAAFASLSAHSEKASLAVPEAVGLARFAESAASEVTAAVSMIVNALRHTAESTVAGSGPAALSEPAPRLPLAPPVPTKRVVLRYDSRWSIGKGMQQTRPSGWPCELPEAVALRALAAGVVVEESDPRVADLITARGSSPHVTDPARCVDLDADPPVPPPDPPPRQITYRDLPRNQQQAGGWRWPAGGEL